MRPSEAGSGRRHPGRCPASAPTEDTRAARPRTRQQVRTGSFSRSLRLGTPAVPSQRPKKSERSGQTEGNQGEIALGRGAFVDAVLVRVDPFSTLAEEVVGVLRVARADAVADRAPDVAAEATLELEAHARRAAGGICRISVAGDLVGPGLGVDEEAAGELD